jgi:hypothetical protein
MCTLGSVRGRYLFKNRDIESGNSFREEIVHDSRRYSYVGVAGKTNEFERGLNSGINEKGVAAAITYVGPSGSLSRNIENRIPRGVIVEDIVGNAGNLLEAAEIAQWHLNRDTYVGGNIVIVSGEGIVSIEEIDRRFGVAFIDSEFFLQSNHFLNLNRHPDEGDSTERFAAINRLFAGKRGADVDVPFIKEVLSYRGDALIFKKREDEVRGVTVSTVIYDIEKKAAHYRYAADGDTRFQELIPGRVSG